MPNPIAFLALAIWPLVALALFGRNKAGHALIWTLLAGYLFLPEPPAGFDLPLLPPLTKHNIPALMAFGIILWRYGWEGPVLPENWLGKILVITFVFSPALTVFTNGEPVFFGEIGLPGLGAKDAAALTLQQFLLILPFLMARRFLADGGMQKHLLWAFLVGGLVYSLLMLIEIRLSPQLNLWVYGYYQHLFGQSIRAGGFRPVVFLYHGLWVAFYCMMAVVSAYALWKYDQNGNRLKYLMAALYLTAIMVLAKSLGALIFTVGLVPLIVLLGPVNQINAAILIGLLAFTYPVMKGADVIPEDRIVAAAASIDPERANSLDFRFDNELTLLDRAERKPLFGWGSWGRNHILDPATGNILTVTDGRWIILIGTYGWVGFLAEFGLLLLPLLLIWREAIASTKRAVAPFVAPLALLLAINMFDMIPNATLTPLTWLIAGAMTGYAEQLKAERLRVGKLVKEKALKWQSIM